MSPYPFLRAIGTEPWNAAYVEPSRRPGRWVVTEKNPNRLFQHHNFQVVMKPSPRKYSRNFIWIVLILFRH